MACRFHLDTLGLGDWLTLVGWAVSPADPILRLGLTWDDRPDAWIPAEYGQPRPDVAAARGTDPACGFRIAGVPAVPGRVYRLSARLASGRPWSRPLLRLAERRGEIVCDRLDGGGALPLTRLTPAGLTPSLGHLLARYRPDRPAPAPLERPVLILVAIYRRADLLAPFLDSLFAHTTAPFRLVLIDDGGEDPAVTALLAEARARDGRVEVVTLDRNGGFVEAVSRGFESWRGEHVVLANSDTVLPPGWLERLVGPLERDPRIASATPYANAAQICGFPAMPGDNPLYLGLDVAAIDAVFAGLDPEGMLIDLPTGVGFCMAMSRHALAQIGFFERGTFGAGYGEENDWCRKAAALGLRNVLVPNLFVYHQHGASFPSELKRRQIERNLAILTERYPDYPDAVRDHILADPGLGWRRFAAFLLAARAHPDGALLALSGADSPGPALRDRLAAASEAGRPLACVTRRGLAFTITLSWAEGWLELPLLSLGDLAALRHRCPVGTVVVGDLAAAPFPVTLAGYGDEVLEPLPAPSPLDRVLGP